MSANDQTHDRGRVGRYRILGQLGQGGMGCLYLARSEGPGGFERLAVLKMIHEHLSREPAFIEMFLQEARIAARIHHPNVVTVYEIGEHAGRYFIAMDYIHGETFSLTLSHRWKRGAGFPFEMAAHIVASTADGLHQAHELCDPDGQQLGVVHRDVSPANVMIGYDGNVRVMDFGIAKATARISLTEPGFRKGKAPYMAPEQILDEPVDRRVDVFALGILLWESTVGKRLFKGSNELATLARIVNGQVPLPSALRKDYPQELEAIVMRALSRSPSERYPTARAMAEDLRAFMRANGRLVSAVDVERFMRETFPDRHATRVSMLTQASAPEPPTVVHLREEAPSLSRVPSDVGRHSFVKQLDALIAEELADEGLEATAAFTPRPRADSFPTIDVEHDETAFVEPINAGRRARAMLLAGALIVFGGVVGSLAAHELRMEEPLQPEEAHVESEAPSPPKEPVRVMMSFAVTPANAVVTIDGREQHGPLVVERSDRTYEVRISAPDHRELLLELVGDRDRHVEVALERNAPPPTRPRPKRAIVKKKIEKLPDGLVDDAEL